APNHQLPIAAVYDPGLPASCWDHKPREEFHIMDKIVTRVRTIALLTAGAALVAGCSGADAPADTPADTSAAGSNLPAEIAIPGTGVFPESLTSRSDGTIYIGSVGLAQIYRVPPGEATAQPFIQPGTG